MPSNSSLSQGFPPPGVWGPCRCWVFSEGPCLCRRDHVLAILSLRRLGHRRNQRLLQHAQDLLRAVAKAGDSGTQEHHVLFQEIKVPASVDMLMACI